MSKISETRNTNKVSENTNILKIFVSELNGKSPSVGSRVLEKQVVKM
jgi:hypothetical protein